jgi:hypothetical protein
MATARRRKDDLITQIPTESRLDPNPVKIYQRLVSKSSAIFRSDIEFVEKPRQVVFGAILVGFLFILSGLAAEDGYNFISASRYCLFGFLLSTIIYSMLQTKDGLMVWF